MPPGAAQVAIRIATRVATVYTNAPKRIRETILADLCTLLRRRPGGEAHAAGAVTQPPTHTNSRSPIYEHHPVRAGPLSGSAIPDLLISSARAIVGRERSILTLAFTNAAGAHWRRALTEGHGLPASHLAASRHATGDPDARGRSPPASPRRQKFSRKQLTTTTGDDILFPTIYRSPV